MPKQTTVLVPEAELVALFSTFNLWDKIDNGVLSTVEASKKTAPAKSYPGGTSQILKHYNLAGAHACTTHRIVGHHGEVLHRCEHDIKAGEITIAKPVTPRQANRPKWYLQLRSWWRRLRTPT